MTNSIEPLLRNAMVRTIDAISKKASETERAAEGAIAKLLKRWNGMTTTEKENVAAIVIATATTAVGALAALKARSKTEKKSVKKSVKKAASKALIKAGKKLS